MMLWNEIKQAYRELRVSFTEPVIFFVLGTMAGIVGYFMYYKEEVDMFTISLFSVDVGHIDQAFNGGIGGLLVVLFVGLLIFRAGGHLRPKRAFYFIVGGWAITVFTVLLDLVI
jgi:hypothetical protein